MVRRIWLAVLLASAAVTSASATPNDASVNCPDFDEIVTAYKGAWEHGRFFQERDDRGKLTGPPFLGDLDRADEKFSRHGPDVSDDQTAVETGGDKYALIDYISWVRTYVSDIKVFGTANDPASQPIVTSCKRSFLGRYDEVQVRWIFTGNLDQLPDGCMKDGTPCLRPYPVRVSGTSTFAFKSPFDITGQNRIQEERLAIDPNPDNPWDFFRQDPEPIAPPQPPSIVVGNIKVNGANAPDGLGVTCIDGRTSGTYPTDPNGTTDGDYACTPDIVPGSLSIKANGQTKSCSCETDSTHNWYCNVEVTGCSSPTATSNCGQVVSMVPGPVLGLSGPASALVARFLLRRTRRSRCLAYRRT